VCSKTVFAKIDRVDGIIEFQKKLDPEETMNEWTHKIHSLLQLVAKTTHLIAKEEMVHKIAQ
jgi:26S proteasome regulatory subunit N5